MSHEAANDSSQPRRRDAAEHHATPDPGPAAQAPRSDRAEGAAGPEPDRGLRWILVDGVLAQAMGVLTGGAILVAFAVALGASPAVIGAMAAIGPATQFLQIPAVGLVERLQRRKLIVLLGSGGARAALLLAAAIPWVVP